MFLTYIIILSRRLLLSLQCGLTNVSIHAAEADMLFLVAGDIQSVFNPRVSEGPRDQSCLDHKNSTGREHLLI